jgi:hypothetical protein
MSDVKGTVKPVIRKLPENEAPLPEAGTPDVAKKEPLVKRPIRPPKIIVS